MRNTIMMDIKADTREHCENDILILTEHYGARVIVKPYKSGSDWRATLELPRRKNIL